MENKNGFCLLYGTIPENKNAVEEIVKWLEEEAGYYVNLVGNIVELNAVIQTKTLIKPTLLITDIAQSDTLYNKLREFSSDCLMIRVNDDIDESLTENGNIFKVFQTYKEVIPFLEDELNVPANEDMQKMMDDFDKETSSWTEFENDEDGTEFDLEDDLEDPRELLKNITEYKAITKEKQNSDDLSDFPLIATENQLDKAEKETKESDSMETKNTSDSSSLADTENPYHIRSINVQKGLFIDQPRENHRMIGIWSPLHRMGVTSLTLNFALFLAQNRIDVAVLEGITGQYALKDWLKRYTPVPPKWISCAKAIQTDTSTILSRWKYCNITFLPLNIDDSKYEWNSLSLAAYMNISKVKDIDITLVDMPTGEMASYTEDSLCHLDELWIVVDDAFQETIAWKTYIHEIKEQTGIDIYLLFNKHYSFSQNKRISKELDVQMISCIPSLHEETMQNYYENTPMYFSEEVQGKVVAPFTEMAMHLFNGNFKLNKDRDLLRRTWRNKIFTSFKSHIKN